MNKDMNFEFELKNRFNSEAPPLPDGLKKENVMKMLEKDNFVPKKKKHLFPKVLATAVALIIVVSAIYVMPIIKPEKSLIDVTTSAQQTTESATLENQTEPEVEYEVIKQDFEATKLLQAESTKEIEDHFLKIYRENKIDDLIDGTFGLLGSKAEDAVYNYAADMSAPETAAPGITSAASQMAPTVAAPQAAPDSLVGTGNDDSYGKTNVQVENVDEADIIKNDGTYLYILSGGVYSVEKKVTIVDAKNMKVASTIEISEKDKGYYVQEMYVNGDRLVLLANEYDNSEQVHENQFIYGYYGKKGNVVSLLYDISDRNNPTLVRKVSQDGSEYISSRMIDGVLYTVSSYVVWGNSESDVKENCIPNVNGKNIACDCIYIYDYDSDRYIVLSAYDTKINDGEVTSLSLLGSGREVYCSEDALYVASTNYNYEEGNYTEIYSFAIDKTKLTYKGSGAVKGDFLNQFSFDEHEGNLRVATTYYSYKHDVDVSSIYVLNKNLELIGKLEDIAYDEQVKSVRFMGDTGYIVTFRNTDPLFTLDLSDPTAPKVVGEVKLPGFSSYLHPVGEGLVAGLGYDGDDENADFNSLKVSLFDVSDMKNPKELDTFVLKNVTSAALYNHKAFIYYPEENIIGFPVEHYEGRTVLSYKLLKIENKVIQNHLGFVHKTERMAGDLFRGTYIGDKLYTIDNYNVCEFEINTAAMTRECEILDVEKDMPEENIYGEVVTNHAVMPGGVVATTVAPDLVDGTNTATTVGTTIAPDAVTDAVILPDYAQVPETTVATTVTTSMPRTVVTFDALVVKVGDNVVLVEVTAQGESGLSVGSQVSFPAIPEQELTEGDTIRVTFDGIVAETYPGQISNVFAVERLD